MHDANRDRSRKIGIRKSRQEKHERKIQEGMQNYLRLNQLRLCLGKDQYGLLTPSAEDLISTIDFECVGRGKTKRVFSFFFPTERWW